ncbi:MAG: hypothetical protein LBF97_06205 [Elusimicrobiota bacterium]|jgi:hypothetical protein|nr:hypothetical protein [Elusimicrobiota bacterium]
MENSNNRVRMNLSQTSKGLVQIDITVEFQTVDESSENLDKAIKSARKIIAENGLKEVHE